MTWNDKRRAIMNGTEERNFVPVSVDTAETTKGRLFIQSLALSVGELKALGRTHDLPKELTSGPTIHTRGEKFYKFEAPVPYRIFEEVIELEERKVCSRMTPDQHLWPDKAHEVFQLVHRDLSSSSGQLLGKLTPFQTLQDWMAQAGVEQPKEVPTTLSSIVESSGAPSGAGASTPRKDTANNIDSPHVVLERKRVGVRRVAGKRW